MCSPTVRKKLNHFSDAAKFRSFTCEMKMRPPLATTSNEMLALRFGGVSAVKNWLSRGV